MSRLPALAVITVIVAALTESAWSQQAQTGQAGAVGPAAGVGQAAAVGQAGAPGQPGAAGPGTIGTAGPAGTVGRPGVAGVAGPAGIAGPAGAAAAAAGAGPAGFSNQSSAATAEMPGQSGTFSDFGPVGQRQGQFTPSGQPVHGGQPAANFNNVGGGLINRTPWFGTLAVRRQLQLNALQFEQLNRAYQDSWTRFNQAVESLPSNLILAERARRIQELRDNFENEFDGSLNTTLPNPQLRRRFNQFRGRYQFYGESDTLRPQQSLSLSPEQERRLRLMAHQWNQQMQQLQQVAADDSSPTEEEFNDLRLEAQEQIESVLRPDQLRIWPELISGVYNLPAERDGVKNSTQQDAAPR